MIATRQIKRALARKPALYRGARRTGDLARFGLRRPHEEDFAAFAKIERRGIFLDVGANTGTSALSFRALRRGTPIVSIEANPFHRDDLSFVGRLVRPFEFRIMAASDREGSETLYVPMYGKLPLTGEASFSRERALHPYWLRQQFGRGNGRECDIHEVEVKLCPIDTLGLPAPGWVKIDVEGAEEQVLRGMQNLLAAHRPVLLVENNAERDVWMPLITGLGYGVHRCEPGTRRLLPWDGEEAENLLFLPAET